MNFKGKEEYFQKKQNHISILFENRARYRCSIRIECFPPLKMSKRAIGYTGFNLDNLPFRKENACWIACDPTG